MGDEAGCWGLLPLPPCFQQPVTLETPKSSRSEFIHLQNDPKATGRTTDSVSPPGKIPNSFPGGWACAPSEPHTPGKGNKPEVARTLNAVEGTSLVAQWLGIRLPIQRTRV